VSGNQGKNRNKQERNIKKKHKEEIQRINTMRHLSKHRSLKAKKQKRNSVREGKWKSR